MRSEVHWFRSAGLNAEGNGSYSGPETFTAAELMGLDLAPVKWVIPDLLPEGVTLLAGKPKLGKSWLAFGIAVALASGGVILGTKRVEQGEALYLALEDNQRRLQKRLGKLLSGDGAPGGLHMSTAWPRVDEGGEEALESWLEEHRDARLVVVDVLKRVRPRVSRHRSVYDADYETASSSTTTVRRSGGSTSKGDRSSRPSPLTRATCWRKKARLLSPYSPKLVEGGRSRKFAAASNSHATAKMPHLGDVPYVANVLRCRALRTRYPP